MTSAPPRAPACRACRGCCRATILQHAHRNAFINQFGQLELPTAALAATTVGLSGRIPIYQGGRTARVRRRARPSSRRSSRSSSTERRRRCQRSAFSSTASREAIQSNQIAVNANGLALEAPARANWSAPAPSSTSSTAEQGYWQTAGGPGDGAARRICRRLPAPERDGAGGSAGSRPGRRAALRPARPLPACRRRLERLVQGQGAERYRRDARSAEEATGTPPAGSRSEPTPASAIAHILDYAGFDREPSMEEILASSR